MYLIITAYGHILKTEKLHKGDLDACNDGIISIVDIRGPSEYIDGVWVDLEVWGEDDTTA